MNRSGGRHIIPSFKWTLHLSTMNVWDMGYGKGRVVTYLSLKALVTQGIGVEFVTSADRDEEQKIRLGEEKINIHYTKKSLHTSRKRILYNLSGKSLHLKYYFATKEIAEGLIRQHRAPPFLIIAHSWYNLITAHWLASKYCIPVVARLYGVGRKMPYFFFVLKNPEYVLLSKLSSIVRWIVSDDGTNGDEFLNYLKVPCEKVKFWPSGVNFLKSSSEKNIEENKRLLGLVPSSTVFCAVGRLVSSKGIHLIVDAFARFLSLSPKVAQTPMLLIVGDGKDREILKDRVRKQGIEDYVHFCGPVSQKEISTYLNICDIYVTANQLSAISNCTLEAMSLGKPVIALNTGNSAKLIQNEITGLLLPNVKPVEHLAKAMQRLINDIDKRKKLGREAKVYLKMHWPSWDERIRWEIQEYQTIMKNRGCL